MTCLGLFALPLFAKYPYVDLWDYQLEVALRGPNGILHIPKPILEQLSQEDLGLIQTVFFVVQRAPSTEVNFLPHCWCYPYVQPNEKLGYGNTHPQVGLFTFQCSNALPGKNINWNTVGKHIVHIHPQKGGMCLSPNNGRILIQQQKIACMWSVIKIDSRICVTLHWLICGDAFFQRPANIDDLLSQNGAHVDSLRFLINGAEELGLLDGPVLTTQINQNEIKNQNQGKQNHQNNQRNQNQNYQKNQNQGKQNYQNNQRNQNQNYQWNQNQGQQQHNKSEQKNPNEKNLKDEIWPTLGDANNQ
jgi:hypothetical protein